MPDTVVPVDTISLYGVAGMLTPWQRSQRELFENPRRIILTSSHEKILFGGFLYVVNGRYVKEGCLIGNGDRGRFFERPVSVTGELKETSLKLSGRNGPAIRFEFERQGELFVGRYAFFEPARPSEDYREYGAECRIFPYHEERPNVSLLFRVEDGLLIPKDEFRT